MTTYRERREARADRLREWADGREAAGRARVDQARQRADLIPFGQPILVGHHSEGRHRRDLERIDAGHRRGFEDLAKADEMRARAAEIDHQAKRAIYRDDPDELDRLRAKLATLEAERDRIKRYNATCRKGTPDWSILTEHEQARHRDTLRVAGWQCKGDAFPSYHLSNLSGTIKTVRDRIAEAERRAARVAAGTPTPRRTIAARYPGTCDTCGQPIERGALILYARGEPITHATCPPEVSS